MSKPAKTPLMQAFLADHQAFMRLLRDVGLALKAKNIEQARVLGASLDKLAGPHIAFEESVLYPAVAAESRDRSFVATLYGEHRSIVQALSQLLQQRELDENSLQELQDAFAEGLGHAEHCGTLVSALAELDEAEQERALDKLLQLRGSDVTWTQLKRGS